LPGNRKAAECQSSSLSGNGRARNHFFRRLGLLVTARDRALVLPQECHARGPLVWDLQRRRANGPSDRASYEALGIPAQQQFSLDKPTQAGVEAHADGISNPAYRAVWDRMLGSGKLTGSLEL
jgi:hypothetical protein